MFIKLILGLAPSMRSRRGIAWNKRVGKIILTSHLAALHIIIQRFLMTLIIFANTFDHHFIPITLLYSYNYIAIYHNKNDFKSIVIIAISLIPDILYCFNFKFKHFEKNLKSQNFAHLCNQK